MSPRTRLLILQIAFVLAVCAFLFFFGLGAFGLVGADEPRYAQIAREMFERHDWIVPTLNGQPWLEKPVLLYWKEITGYMFFGVLDWAARVPAAAHATALVLAVFFFTRRFRPGSELDAAMITASSAAIIGFGRGASTDMLLAAYLSTALLAWWVWHQTAKRLWLAGFYVLLALGTLAKGPVAPALAVLIVAAYAALRRDAKVFLRSIWLPGFALFFAVALPWFVAVQVKVPQFFRVFFLEHNLERFGTNLYQHAQPFWYYIPVFLVSTLPWTVFTIPALAQTFRDGVRQVRGDSQAEQSQAEDHDRLALFLLLWTLIPIVFFSISRSKLPGYILPSVPASALLTTVYLHRMQSISRLKLMLHSLLCGIVVLAAMLTPWYFALRPESRCGFFCMLRILAQNVPDKTTAWIAGTVGIVMILVLIIVRKQGLRSLHFATLIPVIMALAFVLRPAARVLDQTLSARAVNAAVDAQLRQRSITPPSLAIFQAPKQRDLAYGLNFYGNRPVTYYESDEGNGPRDLPHGVPSETHVVITKVGNGDAVRAVVGPRPVTALGGFPAQHLEFFLVQK
ncbi:MAG TPA: glycosyltransferase family 39 protein [Candidatus Angelobacter sp.]|nr:glycosyltransferase family 39 protein [Candidatus Angelobacter sp.]